jgi:hypothetical protein
LGAVRLSGMRETVIVAAVAFLIAIMLAALISTSVSIAGATASFRAAFFTDACLGLALATVTWAVPQFELLECY